MSISKQSKSGEYTVIYQNFGGVDLSGSSNQRLKNLRNMYIDYDSDDELILESIPGYRKIVSLGGKIHNIYSQVADDGYDYLIVHSGKFLYRLKIDDIDNISDITASFSVSDRKSSAFSVGSNLYILDGENITRVSGSGEFTLVGEEMYETKPYVPTLFYNGEEYEQKNLLTNRFKESQVLTSFEKINFGSSGLVYAVISKESRECKVIGYKPEAPEEDVYIPATTSIDGEEYSVTTVAASSFYEQANMRCVHILGGVKTIENNAFAKCVSLESVEFATTVESIGEYAFSGCIALERLYFGKMLKTVAQNAFYDCPSIHYIYYEGSESDFSLIEGTENLPDAMHEYLWEFAETTLQVNLYTPASSIYDVKIDKYNIPYMPIKNGELITGVILTNVNKKRYLGGTATVWGIMAESEKSDGEALLIDKAAIVGCTVCECFDGRVFLSGNKNFPNTVFYSQLINENPLYFGELNYFNDGTGRFCVTSMLSSGSSLCVFKEKDDGGGSIFYHTPKSTGENLLPRIYPVSYVHGGVECISESVSFFDDALFLTRNGVCALEKQTVAFERSIAIRSHNVNKSLLTENLNDARICIWCGYLVLLTSGKIYLADSRSAFVHKTGDHEYEWYLLEDIGTYKSDKPVYRYSEIPLENYTVKVGFENEKVSSPVATYQHPTYGEIKYTFENGVRYRVYYALERTGGTLSPAVAIHSVAHRLFFGTESGDICVFNNDKRGQMDPRYMPNEEDRAEYSRDFPRRIPAAYYNFCDRAPLYALETVSDNCRIPNLTKNTKKNSMTLKVKNFGAGSLNLEVKTDRSGYKEIFSLDGGIFDFSMMNFGTLAFTNEDNPTLPIKEKEKKWIEKQINIYSENISSPFGFYSLTYKFTPKGRIKL